jgi:hypothetical protein
MTIQEFNAQKLSAFVVLSRADLKRMLQAIPATNDVQCGVFQAELVAGGDGEIQIDSYDLSSWCRPCGSSEFVNTRRPNERKEHWPITILPRG